MNAAPIRVSRWIAGLPILLLALTSFARLRPSEGTEDIQYLGSSAQFIFHGNIVSFDSTRTQYGEEGFVILRVDHWYKGQPQKGSIRIRFRTSFIGFPDGHDCIDLHRTDSWLIFANRTSDTFIFSDDCEGRLPVSSIVAANLRGTWQQQLQQDLIAGLDDPDSDVRLANIARLGGLKMPTSTTALRRFIENGSDAEKKWAAYAALRSGDLSVLAQVEAIVIGIQRRAHIEHIQLDKLSAAPYGESFYGYPEGDIAIELQHLRDPRAVPALVRILRSAKTDLVRSCAGSALAEIKDPRSATAAAAGLDDSDARVQYNSVVTLYHLGGSPLCEPTTATPQAELQSVEKCKQWWRETGSSLPWPSPE